MDTGKHCPDCGKELVQRTVHKMLHHMYECMDCGMLVNMVDTVNDKVNVTVRGQIIIPFILKLNDQQRACDWDRTEEAIIDDVESTFANEILFEVYGTHKPGHIDATEVKVEEVVED